MARSLFQLPHISTSIGQQVADMGHAAIAALKAGNSQVLADTNIRRTFEESIFVNQVAAATQK